MLFNKYPSISIDYAVMEVAKNIAMVPLKSDWNETFNVVRIHNLFLQNSEDVAVLGGGYHEK